MDSPLTQQLRPNSFEPKIVQLYLHLFNVLPNDDSVEDSTPSEGFWREFYLLKPDKQRLYDILEPMTANDLLHIHPQTQVFFQRTIAEAGSGKYPVNENAIENLTGFLSAVFTKRYTNPSTDVIEVLGGLDSIDKLVLDLVNGLEAIIRQAPKPEFREKAIAAALAMVSGAFQTSLVTYFMHRDLFTAITKYVHDVPDSGIQPFVLLGILASYNKFESQNVYQTRLEDFVNEDTIHILVRRFAECCVSIRNEYLNVYDDSPAPWTLNSTLNLVGLRVLSTDAKKPPTPSEDDAKALFAALPGQTSCSLLSLYSFVQANKIFASNLLSLPAEENNETPFSVFISSTSYLGHHAYRSARCSHYTILSLLTIRLMLEDQVLVKRICSNETKTTFRLCRQRPPQLPLITSPRIPATAILDLSTDILSHNLRKRLDIQLYTLALGNILRIITQLDASKTRVQHHWPYIWGSLISLMRFLTQYATELTSTTRNLREDLCTPLANLTAFCLSRGDSFLPDPASYDDLFYKIIESGGLLPKFKSAYSSSPSTSTTSEDRRFTRAVDALISVSSHYHNLLSERHGRGKTHQSPAIIQKVIKDGYETLNLEVDDDFGRWEPWRESTWKPEIKKMIRAAVEDARVLVLR